MSTVIQYLKVKAPHLCNECGYTQIDDPYQKKCITCVKRIAGRVAHAEEMKRLRLRFAISVAGMLIILVIGMAAALRF